MALCYLSKSGDKVIISAGDYDPCWKPLNLTDALKGYTYDQDKLLTPEETVRRVRDRLAHLDLKLLQETMRIDSGRLDIPVYLSLLGVDARRVVPTHKQMGKGATPVQAEASALMELVERFSFFTYIEDGPLDLGCPRDLTGPGPALLLSGPLPV